MAGLILVILITKHNNRTNNDFTLLTAHPLSQPTNLPSPPTPSNRPPPSCVNWTLLLRLTSKTQSFRTVFSTPPSRSVSWLQQPHCHRTAAQSILADATPRQSLAAGRNCHDPGRRRNAPPPLWGTPSKRTSLPLFGHSGARLPPWPPPISFRGASRPPERPLVRPHPTGPIYGRGYSFAAKMCYCAVPPPPAPHSDTKLAARERMPVALVLLAGSGLRGIAPLQTPAWHRWPGSAVGRILRASSHRQAPARGIAACLRRCRVLAPGEVSAG